MTDAQSSRANQLLVPEPASKLIHAQYPFEKLVPTQIALGCFVIPREDKFLPRTQSAESAIKGNRAGNAHSMPKIYSQSTNEVANCFLGNFYLTSSSTKCMVIATYETNISPTVGEW